MKLQVVTVSVNYSDFLEHTLESNKKLFDKWVIVTDLSDNKTKELCDRHGVHCVQTNAFYENGARFNKYAGINEGLKYVDEDAWILFLDSDIVLHYSTRRILEELHLDETCLYGMDRLNIQGATKWKEYRDNKDMLRENWLLSTESLQFGARLVHHYGHEGENGRFEGWRPLGYFQLCHKTTFENYPQESKSADHCDLIFARRWPRSKRFLIPEIYAIHLESEHAGKAMNWNGRKSQPFDIPKEEGRKEEEPRKSCNKKKCNKGCLPKVIVIIIEICRRKKKCHHYYGRS